MESKIDWSKAPEDADKYNTHNGMFYKGERPYLQVFIHEQWMPSAIMKSNELFVYRPSTPSWSGEGLPPVGVVCEMERDTGRVLWHKVRILYIGSEHAIVVGEQGEQHFLLRGLKFRPIRTPEQIAADERERMANMLWQRYLQPILAPAKEAQVKEALGLIYDDFYRKP